MKNPVIIIRKADQHEWEKGYTYIDFREVPEEPPSVFIGTAHREENYNNIELFKLALYCRKKGTKLVMFGQRNHLPLFSTFADAMIYPTMEPDQDLYGDFNDNQNITTYDPPSIPNGFGITDLSLYDYVDHEGDKPSILGRAMLEISDEEVVEHFTDIQIHVLEQSVEVYDRLRRENVLLPGFIVCEMKEHAICHGPRYREIADQAARDLKLPFITAREWLHKLAKECGQDYMAVQCLASAILNWSWICDGGSANIFSFFPFKVLAMRDVFIPEALMRELHHARFGRGIFPYFNTESFFARLDTQEHHFIKMIENFVNET